VLCSTASRLRAQAYGRVLAEYIDDPSNLFVVSSDFCHWGRRFGFMHHDKSAGPIHNSVEQLDRLGMRLIEGGDPAAFTSYIQEFGNTICGRHPIGVLMHAMSSCRTRFTSAWISRTCAVTLATDECMRMAHASWFSTHWYRYRLYDPSPLITSNALQCT
jgi:AmmeMemoRadiSam system protein B